MNDGGVWSSRALRSFGDDPEGVAELWSKWAELKGTMLRGDAPGSEVGGTAELRV